MTNIIKAFSILLLAGSLSIAKENWLCTEASSQRLNNTILACGIGYGKDEAEARLHAFDSAKAEFGKICDASADCIHHEANVDPKRTSCEEIKGGYKCYRAIEFQIELGKSSPENIPTQSRQSEVSSKLTEYNNGGKPKLRKGLKISQVIAMFGKPDSVDVSYDPVGKQFLFLQDESKLCDMAMCYVYFDLRGRVIGWSAVKPEFTTDLDDLPEKRAIRSRRSSPPAGAIPINQFRPFGE